MNLYRIHLNDLVGGTRGMRNRIATVRRVQPVLVWQNCRFITSILYEEESSLIYGEFEPVFRLFLFQLSTACVRWPLCAHAEIYCN